MVFIASTIGIVVLTSAGVIGGGMILKFLKKPVTAGMRIVNFLYYTQRAHRKIKKGIMRGNIHKLRQGVKLLEVDKEYHKYKDDLFKLYNLTDEIVNDVGAFNDFYRIQLPEDEIEMSIVNRYCEEHSMTLVRNSIMEENTPPPEYN